MLCNCLFFQSGAAAGMAVDLSLYPLDTIKTRLQSSQGFWKAGGFRSIYSGIGSVVIGSSPGCMYLFLCSYFPDFMFGVLKSDTV